MTVDWSEFQAPRRPELQVTSKRKHTEGARTDPMPARKIPPDAVTYYVSLGPGRSYQKVAEHYCSLP